MEKAFTLIELLVVVLIIGILAAVAVPQYQKAVDKAHFTQLLTLATAAKNAQEEYYLANGQYSTSWDYLSLQFDGTKSGKVFSDGKGLRLELTESVKNAKPNAIYGTDTKLPGILLILCQANAKLSDWDNDRYCYASANNTRANNLCKSVSGKKQPTCDDYCVYKF